MEYIVVSRIVDSNNHNLLGFTVVSQDASVKFLSIEQITQTYEILKSQGKTGDMNFLNAEYSEVGKTLNGTMGSLTKYPAIDNNYNIVTRGGITVLKVVLDSKTNKPIGCICYNALGVRYNLSFKKMMELAHSNIQTNYEFKSVNGVSTVVPKGDRVSAFPTIAMEVRTRSKNIYRSADGESVDAGLCSMKLTGSADSQSLPSISGVYHFDDYLKNSSFNMSANEKMTAATYNLAKISPYYYHMFQAIDRYPMQGLGTLGVTEDKFYYDVQFISGLTVGELTFILIHEMCHIAMQHSYRQGNRNHSLWNIATDLYINTLICNDFSNQKTGQLLIPGGAEIDVTSPNGEEHGVIKTPSFGVFVETTGETFDLSHDVPESIYLRLVQENPDFGMPSQQGQQSSKSQQGQQGQQGSQSQQGSQGQSGQQGSQSQQGQQSSQGQSGQQGSQGSQGQQSSQSQPDSKAFEEAVGELAKAMEKASKNTCANGTSQNEAKSDAGCQDVVDGVNEVRDGIKNNDQNKINSGNQKIQQGIDKIKEAQKDAGADQNKDGQSASKGLDDAKQKIDESLGQGQGQQNNQSSQGQQGNQNSQGQQGQQGGQNSQGQQGGQDSQGQQSGQGSQGQGQSSQGQQSGQDSQGQQGDQDSQGSSDSGSDVFDNQPDIQTNQNQGYDDLNGGSDFNNKIKEVEVNFNGKKIKGKIIDDIMSNHEVDQQKDLKQRAEESRQALQNINTKIEMEKNKGNNIGYGKGGSLVQRHIDFGLAQGVDWRVLLRNVCKREKKKMYTLTKPNRTYMQMGRTVASRQTIGNTKQLKDIKICIDVSGSVSDSDLTKYMSEINNIFRYFDVDGELIYWSTKIGNVGSFKELKDMLKINPSTTGGTDVKCVFDYLSGKIKVNDRKEETRVRDISCVLIITDGQFSNNYGEYEKYFGKKTIWLIDGSPITFNKIFGKVVSLIDENTKK